MNIIAKLQPLFILTAACAGILLGKCTRAADVSTHLIEIFLMILLYFVFTGIEPQEITKSFKNLKFGITSLVINFIWTPVFAFLLGGLFMSGNIDLRIGFLMLMITPCTDWYIVFTNMSKGNAALGASILPVNLILQIALMPVYLWIFMRDAAFFSPLSILYGITFMLAVPLLLSLLTKYIAAKRNWKRFEKFIAGNKDGLQLLFLCLAITAMFASQGVMILENPYIFMQMFLPLVIFFTVNFIIALNAGKAVKMSVEERISLVFTTSARNSPIALAIAIAVFPERPVIALALVIGPLIELPILAALSFIIRKYIFRA